MASYEVSQNANCKKGGEKGLLNTFVSSDAGQNG